MSRTENPDEIVEPDDHQESEDRDKHTYEDDLT